LARELERRLDRLRTAGNEVDVRDARRRMGHEVISELLGHRGREEARVRIGDSVDLLVHRPDHVRVAVPKAGDRRATRSVEVFAPSRVDDADPASACGEREARAQTAMENMAHDELRWRVLRGERFQYAPWSAGSRPRSPG